MMKGRSDDGHDQLDDHRIAVKMCEHLGGEAQLGWTRSGLGQGFSPQDEEHSINLALAEGLGSPLCPQIDDDIALQFHSFGNHLFYHSILLYIHPTD